MILKIKFFLSFTFYLVIFIQSNIYSHESLQLPTEAKTGDEYYKKNELQEALWAYCEAGNIEMAKKVRKELRKILKKDMDFEFEKIRLGGKWTTIKIKFKCGIEAIFKPKPGLFNIKERINSDYNIEIAAYRLDRILKLNFVPMTVTRTINKRVGSLQYFVKDAITAKSLEKYELEVPKKLKFFDYLLRNVDRRDNPGNYLYKEGRTIAIDHGWCFRTNDWFHDLDGKARMPLTKGRIFDYLPDLETYNKLKTIENKYYYRKLKKYLSKFQIYKFIRRKNHFIKKVEKWIKKEGDIKPIFETQIENPTSYYYNPKNKKLVKKSEKKNKKKKNGKK